MYHFFFLGVSSSELLRFLKYFENREIANEVLREKGMKKVRFGVEGTYLRMCVCIYICKYVHTKVVVLYYVNVCTYIHVFICILHTLACMQPCTYSRGHKKHDIS